MPLSFRTVRMTNTFCMRSVLPMNMINIGSMNLLNHRHNRYQQPAEKVSADKVSKKLAEFAYKDLSSADCQFCRLSSLQVIVKVFFLRVLDFHAEEINYNQKGDLRGQVFPLKTWVPHLKVQVKGYRIKNMQAYVIKLTGF